MNIQELNIKSLFVNLLRKADVPKLLNATVVTPPSVSATPTYKTVSAIDDYNAIAVRFMIKTTSATPVDTILYFPRVLGDYTQSMTWHDGTTYVRGRVSISWSTSEVGVALADGNATNAYCAIQQVFGMSHK